MNQVAFSPREVLLDIYAAELHAVDGRSVVRHYLQHHPVRSTVDLVAIGKAAASMTQGALDVLDRDITRALIITKTGYCDPSLPFGCLEAGHPVPNEGSLAGGEQLLQFVASTPEDTKLLFLISGGTSSLVEVPPEDISLDELRRITDWLLGSGLDISAMNSIRKRFSCIKGGRLAEQLHGHSVLNLMISDVVGDDPATIGSGLLVPDGGVDLPLWNRFPAWLQILLRRLPAVPDVDTACFRSVKSEIIANNQQALDAAAEVGKVIGYSVYQHSEPFFGDALQIAARFSRQVLDGPAGLYLWGGESTVTLPPSPGRGGRNQSLALAAAQILADSDSIFFLAAGTDGTDGLTEEAGALVDGGTVGRGRNKGLDSSDCLSRADAGSFLEASDDLICTGPTGTNVMDLILALKV